MHHVAPPLALLFTLATASDADLLGCRKPAERYEAAVAEVVEAMRAYEKCVSTSRGRDTCSAEFSDIDLAQDGFEAAVSEYAKACR